MAYATVKQYVSRFGYSATANMLASLECGAKNDPELLRRVLEGHDCVTAHEGNIAQYPAGEDLSGHIAVSLINDALYVTDPTDQISALACVGMTDSAFSVGQSATAIIDGNVEFSGWTFSTGVLFVGTSGVLTPVVPTSGFLIPFARVIGDTRIQIDIDSIVNLGV